MSRRLTSLCLIIHSHQPVGNFEHVIEEAYQNSYAPFLAVLERHPGVRLSLHYSGVLWQWIESHHPEFLRKVRGLTEKGQVEHVGGGYFEPILASIPDEWKVKQIRRQAEFLRDRFGVSPRGAWVAERVWEQGLISPLAEAGVEYTVLDDTHFLAAGAEPEDLHQAYLTEDAGSPLELVPSLQPLRYTIPFRDPEETIAILRTAQRPGALFAVGDDCEKFGVWPGTYQHCYEHRWLDRFFEALEASRDWLDVTTVSDYLTANPPRRRIYLPTASYAEMMIWALPSRAAEDLEACMDETGRMAAGTRFRRFLRGGPWRNFLSKYPESNQTQKLMLHLAQRWSDQRRVVASGATEDALLTEAETHLLAAQCNDSYWHGIFGGLYAPHLRSAVQQALIRAESLLDRIDGVERAVRVERVDFDLDGSEELLAACPGAVAILRPSDGGSISSLRAKFASVELINSIERRHEAYHRRLMEDSSAHSGQGGAPASIHDQMPSKEANLATRLRYDKYRRHAFRSYAFPGGKTWQDFAVLALDESPDLSGGAWNVERVSTGASCDVALRQTAVVGTPGGETEISATKSFKLSGSAGGDGAWDLASTLTLTLTREPAFHGCVGTEVVLNLLAPSSPDRYFRWPGGRQPLGFGGEIAGSSMALVDEWQRVEIQLEAPGAAHWWVAPIETISQSEAGLERVYQGSAIMAVWRAEVSRGAEAAFAVEMRVRGLAS